MVVAFGGGFWCPALVSPPRNAFTLRSKVASVIGVRLLGYTKSVPSFVFDPATTAVMPDVLNCPLRRSHSALRLISTPSVAGPHPAAVNGLDPTESNVARSVPVVVVVMVVYC
jgi:hypothetical protein